MTHFISFINNKIIPIYKSLDAVSIIIYVLLFISIFVLLEMLAKNNASKVSVWLSFFIIIISMLSLLTEFDKTVYILLLCSFIICVVVMFSTEIKRSVWNTKASKRVSIETANSVKMASNSVNKCINEIIKALQNMSKNDIGAILVLSNTKIPGSIIDSGVKIDSDISSALIESIFFPKTPLHDGAIIIQNDKIQAAGCFLPLSQEGDLPKELGTRHRAGIGVTEVLNVTAIIVSEETGIISIARGGKIVRYADSEMLRQTLKEYYWQDLIVKGK